MRAIDRNVLVCLLARDDQKQVEAAEAFVAAGAWVSHLALVEALWVLDSVYQVGSKQLVAALRLLLEHENLVVQDAETVAAAVELLATRPKLGFSDCMMLEVARRAGHLPLGTFDAALGKADGAHLLKRR